MVRIGPVMRPITDAEAVADSRRSTGLRNFPIPETALWIILRDAWGSAFLLFHPFLFFCPAEESFVNNSIPRLAPCALVFFVSLFGFALPGLVDSVAVAADPAFVGVLALAVDDQVAERIGLTGQTKAKLLELIDRREEEAIEMVLTIRDLSAAEQVAKLSPFVAESERQGLELLSVAQREKLQAIRVAREGMTALGEAWMAASLGLSDEQQAKVADLLKQRAVELTKGGENQRRLTRAIFERQLAAVLTPEQNAVWQKLAGQTDAAVALAPKESPATAGSDKPSSDDRPADQPKQEPGATPSEMPKPAEEKPSEDKPAAEKASAENMPADPNDPQTDPADDDATPESGKPNVADPKVDAPADNDVPAKDVEKPQPKVGAEDLGSGAPSKATSARDEPRGDAKHDVPPGEEKLRFNFASTPWQDVLDWFAEEADLSLAVETLPLGTFTYRDNRSYTIDEAIDLVNSYLLTKGFTLVRRDRILLVIDLENPVPDELVTLVTTEELDKRGRFELVKCLFPLARMSAEDAAAMVEEYLGPQGQVIPFPKARQILVQETGGKLRTIRDMIARVEDPNGGGVETVVEISLKYTSADEVLSIARPLLGLEEAANTSEEISMSVDLLGTRIFATGNAEKLQLLRELVPKIDKAPDPNAPEATEPEQFELRSYYIKAADPDLTLRVLQTLLANLPGVRLDVDQTSKRVVALARPSEHKTIKDTLDHLEGQTKVFEVIPLRRTDPQLAVAAVTKFFNLGTTGEAGAAVDPDAPIVDGDPASMQLWVRGTEVQIQQIKDLVAKLEGPEATGAERARLRMLPLTGADASSTVETIKQFWTLPNQIKMVAPSALTPSGIRLRTVTPLDTETEPQQPEPEADASPCDTTPPRDANPPRDSEARRDPSVGAGPSPLRIARSPQGAVFQFASQPSANAKNGSSDGDAAASNEAAAEIRIAVTPGGILIASEDLDALDEFEKLLRTVSGPAALAPPTEITVFYLRFAKAEVASQLLQEILGGSAAAMGDTGSLLGDMASGLFGGGLLGGLLGGMAGGDDGGETGAATIQASGTVSIVADPRLNALIVQANPVDLALIEQLLKVIDKEGSITEIQTAGVPRIIPVVYTSATEIASVVQQVFAGQIATAGGQSQQQRQPSPEDFIRALRGQRGGGRQEQSRGEEQKMSISVDARSNSIIVTGPEPLFKQVEALVKQIDQPGNVDSDVVVVAPIRVSDPEVVQRTLNSILQSTTSRGSSTSSSGGGTPSPSSGGDSGGAAPDQIRQRLEFLQRLQQGVGGGGPRGEGFGSGRGGGGPRGGSFGGGGRSGRGR